MITWHIWYLISGGVDICGRTLSTLVVRVGKKMWKIQNKSQYSIPWHSIISKGLCFKLHEIKRRLLLGRKVMTNLDSVLKSRDITFPTKVHIVKVMVFPILCHLMWRRSGSRGCKELDTTEQLNWTEMMVFPVVMCGCKSWTIKMAEQWRTDAFELWCWRRFLSVPWTARRSNQAFLKEISSEYSLEGLIQLQYFGCLMWSANSLKKDPDAGKDRNQEEKGMTEDEMVEWHHRLNGHEFEQTLGDGEGKGSLACCSPWGLKESDRTEWLNNNKYFK